MALQFASAPEFIRPLFEDPEGKLGELPAHLYDVESHVCLFCHEEPIFPTYQSYVDHFYAFEYEGEPGHYPQDEDEFNQLANLCLSMDFTV